ncbi:MAG: TolC family protein [Simkaniaceae bacterium]
MPRRQVYYYLSFCLLTGCIDYRGARDPYAYAPRTSHTTWKPSTTPARIPDCLNEEFDFLEEVKPLSLAEALDIALINNPITKSSWASARVSAAEYGQALKNDFILADVNAEWKRLRQIIFVLGQRQIFYQGIWGPELDLSYLLLDFGQTRYSSQAALESLFNADWMHNRRIQDVIQTVMNDYYNYLYQKERLVAAEADVENAFTTLEATMSAFYNGLADVSDKVQATTTLKQNQLALVEQKQSLHTSYTKLINDLGVPPNLRIKFLSYPDKIKTFDVETLDQLILTAMKSRPDLLAAEANVKSGENALTAAQRLHYPVVTTDFDIGRKYYSDGFNDRYNFTLSAALTFPLFQGFFIENTVKQASAELEIAQAELDQTRLSVLQDVTNYREDVVLAKEALVYAKEFLVSAEEEFRVLLEKYRVGTTTIVDLISAQTAVSDARAKYAFSERNWYSSLVNLAFGTGALNLSDAQDHDQFRANQEVYKNEKNQSLSADPSFSVCEEGDEEQTPAFGDDNTCCSEECSPLH